MYSKRLIYGYTFFISLSILGIYMSGITILPRIWWALLAYAIITYILLGIWSMIRPRPSQSFLYFFIDFLYRASITLSITFLVLATFLVYQNNIFPAQLPNYTLSNGEKTVQFQTMSHIASENFYWQVKQNIFYAKKQDFVLFYEWVLPGTEENQQDFNSIMWINFQPGLYENLSKIYGVVAQDNDIFLSLHNEEDYNIDISIDEIMEIYRKKTTWKPPVKSSILENKEVYDLNNEVFRALSELSKRELIVLRYINQSFLNFMIKHEWIRNVIISKLGKQDIFSVILDDRNKHLAQEILVSDKDRIYIIYGLMHFSGVYDLLKISDPNWQVIGQSNLQVIQP